MQNPEGYTVYWVRGPLTPTCGGRLVRGTMENLMKAIASSTHRDWEAGQ
jgi:hypothetical protein